MTEFNLRAAVDQVIDESGLIDPREIAQKVAENVPAKQRTAVLTALLADYVRVHQTRRRQSNPVIGSRPSWHAQAGALTKTDSRAKKAHNPSRKVVGIRDAWRKHLNDSVHVGKAEHIRFGDCTFDNLMFAAAERQAHAEANAAASQRFVNAAQLLKRHKAQRVRDLPEDVLRGLLDEERAA